MFERHAWSAHRAHFASEHPPLQRVNPIQRDATGETQQQEHNFVNVLILRRRTVKDPFNMVQRVVLLPGVSVSLSPLLPGHEGMVHGDVFQIVFVHIRVHPHTPLVEILMILGTRQWGQTKKLKTIQRELSLDDVNVAGDGFGRVCGKAQDVPGHGRAAMVFPCLKHLAVFPDFVLVPDPVGGDSYDPRNPAVGSDKKTQDNPAGALS